MISEKLAQVIAGLPTGAFAADGKPKVKALEDAYAATFPDDAPLDLDAAGRDTLWAEYHEWLSAEDAEPFDAPAQVCVTLTQSSDNPLKVVVNGKLIAEMQVGVPTFVSQEALSHLRGVSGVTFTEE